MGHLIINGGTFNGIPGGTGDQARCQPTGIETSEIKIGVTLVAANGTRNRVERGVNKQKWVIPWEKTNVATYLTLRAIQRLNTTFAFVDTEGTAYTAQTEDDEFTRSFSFIDAAGVQWWDVVLTIYER